MKMKYLVPMIMFVSILLGCDRTTSSEHDCDDDLDVIENELEYEVYIK